jgi:exopolyphosphatase/guanosine-5'-triphosphate,3'-diphosphate pyrophosphatase
MSAPQTVVHGIIDIGSNAIRMQIVAVENGRSKQLAKRRAEVRLGSWVFEHGMISDQLQHAVLDALRSFQVEFASQGVQQITAIATSATREAANHSDMVALIRQELGIELSVISGQAEADLLVIAMSSRIKASTGRSLWIDLGGGSVEVVAMDAETQQTNGASYPLGALRLLRETSTKLPTHGPDFSKRLHNHIMQFEDAIRSQLSGPVQRCGVAGGSLTSLERLMREEGDSYTTDHGVRVLARDRIAAWEERLAESTTAQRIAEFNLRPNRADTIVPAAAVTICIAKIAGITEILVPNVDLKDGLIEQLRNPKQ